METLVLFSLFVCFPRVGYVTILLRIVFFKFCPQESAKSRFSSLFRRLCLQSPAYLSKDKGQISLRSSLGKHNIQAVKEVYFVLSWEFLELRIEWRGKRITNTNLLCPLTTQKRLKLEPGLLEPTKSAAGDRSLSNQKRFYTVPESVPMCSMPCYKSMSQPRIRTKHTIFACKSWFLPWILKRLILPCGPDRVRKEVNSR